MSAEKRATTPAVPLDKQIRLRASAEEKAHLETAAKDGNYENVSDYLRAILFGNPQIIVTPNGEFIVIPAWSADADQREAALTTVKGLVQLAASLAGEETSPEAEARSTDLPPEAPVGAVAEEEPAAPVGEMSGSADGAQPEQQTLAAVPDPPAAPQPPAILGPVPAPTEDYEAFMARRVPELEIQGRTQLMAGYEADAEWRNAAGVATASQQPAPETQAAQPPQANFCTSCGTALGGVRFCPSCGSPAA